MHFVLSKRPLPISFHFQFPIIHFIPLPFIYFIPLSISNYSFPIIHFILLPIIHWIPLSISFHPISISYYLSHYPFHPGTTIHLALSISSRYQFPIIHSSSYPLSIWSHYPFHFIPYPFHIIPLSISFRHKDPLSISFHQNAHKNESCHTYEGVMAYVRTCVTSQSHVRMSHVPHANKHLKERILVHSIKTCVQMSHVTHTYVSHVTDMSESCPT